MRWRNLVVYDREGAAGGGGGGEAPAAAQPPEGAAAAGAAAEQPQVSERPPWLPEKFASPEELARSYGELEKWKGQKQDSLRAEWEKEAAAKAREGVPEKPEEYGFSPPEGLLPEGFQFTLDEQDPFLGEMRGLMHEVGAKPEQWNKAMEAFLRWQVGQMPKPAEEMAKLGEGGRERVAAVDQWLARALPEGEYRAVARGLTTAEGVAALERIMRAAGGVEGLSAAGVGGLPTAGGPSTISPERARELIAHPDYRNEGRGKALRDAVRDFLAAGGKLPGYGG